MRTVGLKVLKNKLSEYIRLVATGETVLVTDRDKVVAELRPPAGRSELISDALLAEAMRKGWLSAPMLVREGPPPSNPVASFDDVMRDLAASRDDR
jgi:antitoxin (DNA-binding transcriptional repressor) of toxin-antitoxin stability system